MLFLGTNSFQTFIDLWLKSALTKKLGIFKLQKIVYFTSVINKDYI